MGWWDDAWDWVTDALEWVWDGLTSLGGAVVTGIEILLSPIGILLGYALGAVYIIPFFGPIAEGIINTITTIIWYVVGIVDFILSLLGIRPEKKLRVTVIALKDKNGPMASEPDITNAMRELSKTFKNRANIRIINNVLGEFTFEWNDVEPPAASWIYYPSDSSSEDILEGECDSDGFVSDLGTDGSRYEALSTIIAPWSSIRRLTGYGAPIFIFIIRNFSDPSKNGCSMGSWNDYVLIAGHALKPDSTGVVKDKYLIAHECAHACNLWHVSSISNLLYSEETRGDYLTDFQISLLRISRHVSYF